MNRIRKGFKVLQSFLEGPKYMIRRGYIHRNIVPKFDDISNKDEWQKEVYAEVAEFMQKNNYSTICDIGCGSGYKLIQNFENFHFEGVEIEPTLSTLRNTYPQNKWQSLEDVVGKKYDVILLSDVIEHIKDPGAFLDYIKSNIKFRYLFISTPDRDLLKRPGFNLGPPRNIHHYREWNNDEFNAFISTYFKVVSQKITNEAQGTQLIQCKNK